MTLHHIWTTVAVTALPPGWRNVYRHDGGTITTSPCPGVLLQELRSTERYAAAGTEVKSRRTELEPPYDTRAVFAEHEDGDLGPADDVGNYVTTVGPDQDPQVYAA